MQGKCQDSVQLWQSRESAGRPLISFLDCTTGRSAYTGVHVSSRSRADLLDCKDLASQGYMPDIYTAFMAYGWHWGVKLCAI